MALEEFHPAHAAALILTHGFLLCLAGRGDTCVALLVVRPRLARGDPAAGDSAHRAIDVEHFEEHFQGRTP